MKPLKTNDMKMKNIRIAVFLFLVVFTACDDKFEEINKNPNSVVELDSEYLFANAVQGTLRGRNNLSLQFPFGSQFSQIYVGRNNSMFIDRYYDYFESDEYKYLFEQFYYGPIRLIEDAIKLTKPGGVQENDVKHAMAKIVGMINYARLADSFGSIPYSQGGLGQEGVLLPAYDSVEFIYRDMLEQLKVQSDILKSASAAEAYPGADPLFDNDLDKWVRFANSFRLRMAMRARFADPDYANNIIVECLSLPLIEENDQNAWNENRDSDIGEFQNPIYSHYGYWQWKMSKTLVETLKQASDPRLPIFVKPTNSGEYVGMPNGLSDLSLSGLDLNTVSDPTDILVGKAAPIYLLTAAEVWLLKAEAALFDIVPGDANALYQTGITKSMEQWGVSVDDIDSYIANSTSATLEGELEQKFNQISTQLLLAYLSNEAEGWANIRRTGYPLLPQRTEPDYSLGVTNGVLPKRLKYPSSEVNINHENYLDAINQQGADKITTALWWDVRD